jgi:hypothetical protein
MMPPSFDLTKLPAVEYQRALHIHACLWRMDGCCASIEAGVALLQASDAALKKTEEAKKIRQLENWQAMALRDGAITIYNFYQSMLAVDQNLKGCDKIISLMNRTEKRRAKYLFESHFPGCVDMRHAVPTQQNCTLRPSNSKEMRVAG